MDFGFILLKKRLFILSLVVLVTFFLSEIVIFMLSRDSFLVISQLIFIIIIIVSLFLPEKSAIVNIFIGLIYLIFSAVSASPYFSEFVPAVIQFYVFIMMSIVISGIVRDISHNEKKYCSLLENTSRGICIYDIGRETVSEKNNSFTYDADAIFSAVREKDREFFTPALEEDHKSSTFEIKYDAGTGRERDLLVFAERLFDTFVLFIVTDITERRKEEENSQIISALSHALLTGSNIDAASSFTINAARNISDTEGVGIYLFDDAKGMYSLFSSRNLPAAFESDNLFIDPGSEPGRIIEDGYAVITTPDTWRLSVTGEIGSGEECVSSLSGREVAIIPFYLTNKPVGCIIPVTAAGEKFSDSSRFSLESIAHIYGSALRRIRAEREIADAKANLESLFDSVDDFIFVYDGEGKILHTNSVAFERLGYDLRGMENLNIAEIHSRDPETFAREVHGLVEGKNGFRHFDLITSGGEKIPVEMKAVAGRWDDVEAFFAIDRDVTLRKKHEDEIRSRDAILDSVSVIAKNLLGTEKWDENIGESLMRLVEAADVSSVCLFESKRIADGSFSPDNIYHRENGECAIVPDLKKFMSLSFFEEWPSKSKETPRSENFRFTDLESASVKDKEIFEELNISTVMSVPLIVDGNFRGCLCLVEEKKRIWSATETEAIVIAAEIISSAIKRTETDEIFRNPIERSLAGVFVVLPDFSLQYVNPKFSEMFGYSHGEIPEKIGVFDLVRPEYRDSITEEAEKARKFIIEGRNPSRDFHFELIGVKKDGNPIDVEVYGSYILYGGVPSFVGMALDITSRKSAERELEESRNQYRSLAANVPGVVFRCLPDGEWTMLYLSEDIVDICGYPSEDFIDGKVRSFETIIHSDDSAYVERSILEAIERDVPWEIEYRICHENGDVIWVYESGRAVRDASGGVKYLDGIILNISSRKKAEKELYETTERLNLTLEGADLGIFDWNIVADTLFYNERLFGMLGYTSGEYERGEFSFDSIIHPEDREEKEKILKEHLEGRTPYYETEYRMRSKDGEWRWISVKGQVVERNPAGEPVRLAGTHLDITEKKEASERINHLNRVLKAVRNVNELIVREVNINHLIKRASELLVETRGYLDAWVILTDSFGSYLASAGSGDRKEVADIIAATESGNPPKIIVDSLRSPEIITISDTSGEETGPGGSDGILLCRRLEYLDTIFGVIIISTPSGLSGDREEIILFNELASDISFAIHDIILQKERESYQDQIIQSLEEKTVLLQEVHHRVKNNLQIISGLIKMQSRTINDPSAKESLKSCENRIMTLAMVHEALYRSEDLSEISAREHFSNLAGNLVDSLTHAGLMKIKLDLDIRDVSLPINIAIPCSLIINEVLSNSIKYAFAGRDSGALSVVFRPENGGYFLSVSDDGVGVPEDFDLENASSLGLRLVRRLATQQLGGTVEIRANKGTSFIFRFPKKVD